MIQIWIDDSKDAKGLLKHINKECPEYSVRHILSASPQPVVNINGHLIIGFGNICRHF